MDRFHEMQVFLAVAEEEGFAAAARRLNTSPPSVTRAIAAMEQRIGTQLLARTTRSLHLTEAGQRYLDDCRRILAELDEAEEAAAGSYSIPGGQLTVTAPVLFGELYVAPVMGEYLDRFPLVSINALLVDRVVNMTDEGVDVAVRIGHLQRWTPCGRFCRRAPCRGRRRSVRWKSSTSWSRSSVVSMVAPSGISPGTAIWTPPLRSARRDQGWRTACAGRWRDCGGLGAGP